MNPRNLNPETQLGRAFTCGILQLVSGWTMLLITIIEVATSRRGSPPLFILFGVFPFIGAILSLFAGSFGVHFGRTGNRCTAVTSMVFSILTGLMSFVGLVVNAFFFKDSQSPWIGGSCSDYRSVAASLSAVCYMMVILVFVLDFVVSIMQAGLACSVACSCCQPANANAAYAASAPYADLHPGQAQNVHEFGDGFRNP